MTATGDRLAEKISRKVEQKVRANIQSLRGDLNAVLTRHGVRADTMHFHGVDTALDQLVDVVAPSIRAKTEDQIIDSLTNPPVVCVQPKVFPVEAPLHPAYYGTQSRGPG